MPEKKDNAIAENFLEQVETFVEAANPIVDFERSVKEKAHNTLEEIRILEEADNSILQAAKPESDFVPKKEFEGLFDQVNVLVQAQNELDQASLKEDHHYQHVQRDLREPGEYNPESVIDERIKEEQKEDEEQDLRNEIVDSF